MSDFPSIWNVERKKTIENVHKISIENVEKVSLLKLTKSTNSESTDNQSLLWMTTMSNKWNPLIGSKELLIRSENSNLAKLVWKKKRTAPLNFFLFHIKYGGGKW